MIFFMMEEYSFVERIFLTLFGIIRLKDSEKSFDNFIDFEKIKKFKVLPQPPE